jgi:uncharacterized protein
MEAAAVRNSEDGALFSPVPESIEVYPSGSFVNLLDPDPDTIHLLDIAHHLSMCCRYAGGVKKFYSVAEHVVLVHDLIPYVVDPARHPNHCVELQRAALLHDAAEAYTGDNTAPLKFSMRVLTAQTAANVRTHSAFDVIADRLDAEIARKFGIDAGLFGDPTLKLVDLWAMRLEAERLTHTGGSHWRWPGDLPYGGKLPESIGTGWPGSPLFGLRPEFAAKRFEHRAAHYWKLS